MIAPGIDWAALPELLRQRRILQLTGWSASTLLRRESAGHFPRRKYHPGCNSPYWVKASVYEWVQNLKEGS